MIIVLFCSCFLKISKDYESPECSTKLWIITFKYKALLLCFCKQLPWTNKISEESIEIDNLIVSTTEDQQFLKAYVVPVNS